MFHYIRLNRHNRFVRSLLLLMLVAWWPSLLQAGCDLGNSDIGSSHCVFCPTAGNTAGHDRHDEHTGNACDSELCPAMEAANHDRLIDQARVIPEKPSTPDAASTASVLSDSFAGSAQRNIDQSLVALGPPLIYRYCTLLN